MVCSNCGAEVRETSKYCEKCGSKILRGQEATVEAIDQEQENASSTQSVVEQRNDPDSSEKTGIKNPLSHKSFSEWIGIKGSHHPILVGFKFAYYVLTLILVILIALFPNFINTENKTDTAQAKMVNKTEKPAQEVSETKEDTDGSDEVDMSDDEDTIEQEDQNVDDEWNTEESDEDTDTDALYDSDDEEDASDERFPNISEYNEEDYNQEFDVNRFDEYSNGEVSFRYPSELFNRVSEGQGEDLMYRGTEGLKLMGSQGSYIVYSDTPVDVAGGTKDCEKFLKDQFNSGFMSSKDTSVVLMKSKGDHTLAIQSCNVKYPGQDNENVVYDIQKIEGGEVYHLQYSHPRTQNPTDQEREAWDYITTMIERNCSFVESNKDRNLTMEEFFY